MDKSYVVLGSSGFVGSNIARHLADYQPILTHHSTPKYPGSIKFDILNDVPDFLPEPPATIMFAAAIEFEAAETVEIAMCRLLPFFKRHRFVYFSSDGIYNGEKGDYCEDDEPEPTTLYGRNLLKCEALIRAKLDDYLILRPSYVYGSATVLDKRLQRVKTALENGEVLSFDDMYKSPLGVKQLVEAAVDLASSDYIGTLHVAGERLSVYDFHRRAMAALGVSTARLMPESTPPNSNFLRDTSLNSSKAWELLGRSPESPEQTLTSR